MTSPVLVDHGIGVVRWTHAGSPTWVIPRSRKTSEKGNEVVPVLDSVHVGKYHFFGHCAEGARFGEAHGVLKAVGQTFSVSRDFTESRADGRSSEGVGRRKEQLSSPIDLFKNSSDTEIWDVVPAGESELFDLQVRTRITIGCCVSQNGLDDWLVGGDELEMGGLTQNEQTGMV